MPAGSQNLRGKWEIRLARRCSFRCMALTGPSHATVEDELFRIGQEAVTNAIRHADAEHISIELNFDGNVLRMTIADDGSGFEGHVNSSGPDGHFGLKGMRERAENIHAKLNVVSAAGKGTKVYVEAPVK